MHLASARHSKTEDAINDDVPSTSGRQIPETGSYVSSSKSLNMVLAKASTEIFGAA